MDESTLDDEQIINIRRDALNNAVQTLAKATSSPELILQAAELFEKWLLRNRAD